MERLYRLRTDEIYDDDGFPHTVYGIDVLNSSEIVEQSVPDIFCNLQDAMNFIDLCNSLDLSIVHLTDAVEDVILDDV